MRSFRSGLTLGVVLFLAALAWGGTRFKDTAGGLPSAAADGVGLSEVVACRGSVRFTDGGTVAGGKLIPYYQDSVLGWFEGPKSSQCTLDTDVQIDGGARRAQICEWAVQNQYGRAALVSTGLTPQAVGIVRLECWGPNLPKLDGGAL